MEYSQYVEDCTKFLQKLVQTPSINGKNNEDKVARLIVEEARRLGLPTRLVAKDSSRPNIFVGNRFEDDSSLLLVAHLDTVPEGDPTKWEHEPFSGRIADNKLFGRGAVDCKGGIALSLYTLKILADQGKLDRAKFVGGVDEESGADSKLGLMYVLDQGLKARGAVYTYGGGKSHDSLTIGHRGVIRLWITCTGESIHSGSKEWQDHVRGENAIEGVTRLLTNLRDFNMPGENQYFPGYGFVLTPTMIEGGKGESIVPDECKVLLDIRTLPEHKAEEIIERIKQAIDELTEGKRAFKVDVKNNVSGALTDPESWIVKEAVRLNQQIFGNEPKLSGSGPANEGYMLINAGIPTITGYGPLGANYHSANEYADLNSIEQHLRFLTELALT
jgi:succinyl-diaminopimelate desuccinylase